MRHMEKIIGTSKLTSKFQITLLDDARKTLGVNAGDKVVFIERDGEVVIRKA